MTSLPPRGPSSHRALPLCPSHCQKAGCHPPCALVGPHHLDGTCDSPGAREGRPWPVCHLLHQLYLMCMPTSHTHPTVPRPLPILGTIGGVSWGPEVVSGNSGEPEKLEVCALGFWSPSLCWFPSIKPQALTQSRGWGRSHIPGLRALPPLWRAPSLDLVLTSHRGGFFSCSLPSPTQQKVLSVGG